MRLELEDDFEVRTADDGSGALRRALTEPLDAMVLDVVMPRIDGLQVLVCLRQAKPDLPIVVVTGLDRAAIATEAMRLGAVDCVTKPFEEHALVSAVRSACSARVHPATMPWRAPASTPAERPCSILLVGRDIGSLATLKTVLGADTTTEVASTVVAALDHLEAHRPVVSIIDDSMEPSDVVSIANAVRRASPRCLLFIGYSGPHDAARHHAFGPMGPDAVIRKPYEFNEVRRWARFALSESTGTTCATARLSAPVLKALEYVGRHYRTATLDAAASAANTSAGQLAHAFSSELGKTFWRHVTVVRLEIVKALLVQTDDKLDHIAAVAGFSDGPHLWRTFYRYFGTRPGAYRRNGPHRAVS